MKVKAFSYSRQDTFVHRLSGLTKLVCFILMTTAVMLTFDIRIILAIMVFSYTMMHVAKITFRQVKTAYIYVLIFLVTNFFLTFFFSPREGVEIYGTEHLLFRLFGPYDVTLEELFYLITKFMKYFSVIPLGMLFILTTNPSEFASALNRIGIPYKVCTTVSLTLRYFPDITRDYETISLAQQARGLEMTGKAKLTDRIKSVASILTPLLLTTMDRIELIANAMDLRGYGTLKKRSWYSERKLQLADWLSMLFALLVLIGVILVNIYVNHGRFYNPFI